MAQGCAIRGRLVAAQLDQVGYAIIDAKSRELFMPAVLPPVATGTIDELSRQLRLPEEALCQTVDQFNAACVDGSFHPTELDGLATVGHDPPKTNWARPITERPFFGYELRPGVTFTYLGLKVDKSAQVQGPNGPVENLRAAGEIMAGSILDQGRLAGFGMAVGTVFGRLAGESAAAHVR